MTSLLVEVGAKQEAQGVAERRKLGREMLPIMPGIKIPQQDFALKMQGGAYVRGGGGYLRDTTI